MMSSGVSVGATGGDRKSVMMTSGVDRKSIMMSSGVSVGATGGDRKSIMMTSGLDKALEEIIPVSRKSINDVNRSA